MNIIKNNHEKKNENKYEKNSNVNHIFFLVMFLCILSIFVIPENKLSEYMVAYPDSSIAFSTEDLYLERTWAPNMKNICEIKVPFVSEEDLEASLKMTLILADTKTEICSQEVSCCFKRMQEGELIFSFDNVKIIPGKQYVFRLEFIDFSQHGVLMIPAGEDYLGCSIGGVEQNNAVNFEVAFEKNYRIEW